MFDSDIFSFIDSTTKTSTALNDDAIMAWHQHQHKQRPLLDITSPGLDRWTDI